MKFLKINISYNEMFSHFFQKYTAASELDFDTLMKKYYQEYYWPSNKLEAALEKLYSWECTSLLFSLEDTPQNRIFYEKWCEKYAPQKKDLAWIDGLLEQIVFYAPNVIYLHEVWFYPKEFFTKIRFLLPGIIILGWDGAPGTFGHIPKLLYVDRVFTCMDDKRQVFEEQGISSRNVGHFFDTDISHMLEASEKVYDVVFAGTINRATSRGRVEMLKMLIANGIKVKIFANTDDAELQKYCTQPVYGNDFLEALLNAKIVLNQHVQENIKYSGNIRMYEGTGVGSLLITDYREDLTDKFVEDKEIVVYRSDKELVEKVNFYLANEALRKSIALKGKQRTQEEYSYKVFAKILYQNVQEFMQKPKEVRTEKLQRLKKHNNQVGLELSKNINTLLQRVSEINKMGKRIAVYGHGNIYLLLKNHLKNIVVVCDQKILYEDIEKGVCNPLELNKYQFDYIVISVLGREKEISLYLQEELQIPNDKMLYLIGKQ
jgi:spore maturation protein CgeB